MDDVKQSVVWDEYFEAEFRSRYFSEISRRLRATALICSVAIGLLSSAAAVNVVADLGAGALFGHLAALLSAAIGIYMSSAGFPLRIAAATTAQMAWNRAAVKFKELWQRARQGEDVTDEVRALSRTMTETDDIVIRSLTDDGKIVKKTWAATHAALLGSPT